MLNSFTGIGNLGRDPETRQTQSNKSVTNFPVACTTGHGDNKQTEWVKVNCWEKTAEACDKYLKKGSKVYFEGRLQTRSYEDKNGETKYSTEVVAHRVLFLDSAADSNDASSAQGSVDF